MPFAPAETAAGGDMFYDLLQTSKSDRPGQSPGDLHTRMFLSSKGEARVERDGFAIAGHQQPGMLLIGSAAKPDESISIDAETRTYTINHFTAADMKGVGDMTSTVTAGGEETILGFHCVHVRVITRRNFSRMFSTTDTLELWKSRDVPVPAVFSDWMTTFENKSTGMIYATDVPAKLKQMGCSGFTVKMEVHTKSGGTSLTLVKAEHRDLTGGLFNIPAGYTETKENQ